MIPFVFFISGEEAETVFVKIMPEFELMPVEITRKTREFQTDAEEYSCEKKEMILLKFIR